MKVSKRTEKARDQNIDRPHITFEGGTWAIWAIWASLNEGKNLNHHNAAIDFCKKLNKALTERKI